ncbi:unnamed protein product [Microthlaspi erraticum]|uniref:Uncharacterized protein n=1 Tax=Microthlaspi erraticum TaxID=1685480 RepID=A0A6D2KZF7_9BRAS|nr:unnamed protein product [Microthlaspi erraticum]
MYLTSTSCRSCRISSSVWFLAGVVGKSFRSRFGLESVFTGVALVFFAKTEGTFQIGVGKSGLHHGNGYLFLWL